MKNRAAEQTSKDKSGKTYSKEFKVEAVKLVKEEGYTIKRASENLGICRKQLGKWCHAVEQEGSEAFRGKGIRTADKERIRQLEKAVRDLRMERDILKKAAIYLAVNK